ncbi:hypothetical protein F5148DRAFT_495817 [Russula earlei]|uniref:Uncharacterized protein n=1 Tax=Russula earlei TaxID=71964 RepID=A0ACC0TXV4_9AGAM|nr:hypothetical protein F5148DRAFT_495817 [Russula earlei]
MQASQIVRCEKKLPSAGSMVWRVRQNVIDPKAANMPAPIQNGMAQMHKAAWRLRRSGAQIIPRPKRASCVAVVKYRRMFQTPHGFLLLEKVYAQIFVIFCKNRQSSRAYILTSSNAYLGGDTTENADQLRQRMKNLIVSEMKKHNEGGVGNGRSDERGDQNLSHVWRLSPVRSGKDLKATSVVVMKPSPSGWEVIAERTIAAALAKTTGMVERNIAQRARVRSSQ